MLLAFEGYHIYQNYLRNHNINRILQKYYNLKKGGINYATTELSTMRVNNRRMASFATDEIFEKLIKVKQFKSTKNK